MPDAPASTLSPPSAAPGLAGRAGRVCLGAAFLGLGLMQVVNGDFVRLVVVPEGPPAGAAVATGVAGAVAGAAIMAGRRLRPAGWVLGALLAGALISRIPEIAGNPGAGFVWTNPAKILALWGGALVAGAGRGAVRSSPSLRPVSAAVSGRKGTFAAGLLAVFLLIAGAQHFVYAGFVDTLVPAWIPPGPRFWTLFTAVALLAAGAGLWLPATRRLAGWLTGVMIGGWVVLLHIPRAVEFGSAFELAGVFEALALGGVAWLIAGADSLQSES